MPTPPPDAQVQSETLEEITERAARALYNIVCFQCSEPFCKHWEAQAATDIEFLLRNERERAAQRCDNDAAEWVTTARNYRALDPMRNSCLSRAEEAQELARAIREGR